MQGGCFYAFIIKIQSGKHLYDQMDVRTARSMKAMNDMDIHEGSTIRVLQKFHDSLIISSANRKIVLGNEVADRIQV